MLQMSYRVSKYFSASFPVINILHCGSFVTAKQPTLVYYYQLNFMLYSDLITFSTNILSLF